MRSVLGFRDQLSASQWTLLQSLEKNSVSKEVTPSKLRDSPLRGYLIVTGREVFVLFGTASFFTLIKDLS